MGLGTRQGRGLTPGVVALALALTQPALAGAGLLLFPAVGTPRQLTVSGRVLKDAPTGGSSTFSKNLRRLAASNWEGAPVEVGFGDQRAQVVSGRDGNFQVTFAAPPKAPFSVGSAFAEAHVSGVGAQAQVQIVSDDAPFLLISDFDDTVAITNVIRRRSLLSSALFKDEETQPAVPGMAALYQCLLAEKKAAPGLAVVSGSPVQFAPRIVAFLRKNGFPFAALYLRDLGPSTLSGYKQPVIRALLQQLPHPVVLVGDSGEHDPEVYAHLRAEFPGRVQRIYIRDAGRAQDAARFPDMLLFQTPAEAARDAQERGLVSAECAARAFPAAVQAP
jgi:phosphatidate phosphatase APP1